MVEDRGQYFKELPRAQLTQLSSLPVTTYAKGFIGAGHELLYYYVDTNLSHIGALTRVFTAYAKGGK